MKMTLTLRLAAVIAAASLLAACSSSGSSALPSTAGSTATLGGSTASGGSAASGGTAGSGNLNACALVPPSLLKQTLGITLPTGVEDDSTDNTFDGPTCKYSNTTKTDPVEGGDVQVSSNPDIYMPNSTYQGTVTTPATAPGITRGLVLGGDGGGTVLVVKHGVGVTVSIFYDGTLRKLPFTTKQLQALAAAVAANL